MISETDFYLDMLRQAVARSVSFPIRTSRDFELLSEAVADAGAGYLSPSTLKRVWGYVRGSQTRHAATLDILSRFAGYDCFGDFAARMREQGEVQSGFPERPSLDALTLEPGATLELSWLPDRRMTLRRLGACRFEILAAANTRLEAGMRVRFSHIVEGSPLVLNIESDAVAPGSVYEIGKIDGVTFRLLPAE